MDSNPPPCPLIFQSMCSLWKNSIHTFLSFYTLKCFLGSFQLPQTSELPPLSLSSTITPSLPTLYKQQFRSSKSKPWGMPEWPRATEMPVGPPQGLPPPSLPAQTGCGLAGVSMPRASHLERGRQLAGPRYLVVHLETRQPDRTDLWEPAGAWPGVSDSPAHSRRWLSIGPARDRGEERERAVWPGWSAGCSGAEPSSSWWK